MVQLPHQHGKNLSYVLEDMPKDGDFSAVSEIFHSVSGSQKAETLFGFFAHYEECVINLSALMGMSSPALSHHLKVLKAQGNSSKAVASVRKMYYTAADGEASRLLHHMIEMLVDISCPREKSEPFTKKKQPIARSSWCGLLFKLGKRENREDFSLSHGF